jgi:hypothetical protein
MSFGGMADVLMLAVPNHVSLKLNAGFAFASLTFLIFAIHLLW